MDTKIQQKRRYFTLSPDVEDVKIIIYEYEQSRVKSVFLGEIPRSMSRFLTGLIIEAISNRKAGNSLTLEVQGND